MAEKFAGDTTLRRLIQHIKKDIDPLALRKQMGLGDTLGPLGVEYGGTGAENGNLFGKFPVDMFRSGFSSVSVTDTGVSLPTYSYTISSTYTESAVLVQSMIVVDNCLYFLGINQSSGVFYPKFYITKVNSDGVISQYQLNTSLSPANYGYPDFTILPRKSGSRSVEWYLITTIVKDPDDVANIRFLVLRIYLTADGVVSKTEGYQDFRHPAGKGYQYNTKEEANWVDDDIVGFVGLRIGASTSSCNYCGVKVNSDMVVSHGGNYDTDNVSHGLYDFAFYDKASGNVLLSSHSVVVSPDTLLVSKGTNAGIGDYKNYYYRGDMFYDRYIIKYDGSINPQKVSPSIKTFSSASGVSISDNAFSAYFTYKNVTSLAVYVAADGTNGSRVIMYAADDNRVGIEGKLNTAIQRIYNVFHIPENDYIIGDDGNFVFFSFSQGFDSSKPNTLHLTRFEIK